MALAPCYLIHGGEPLQTGEIISEITQLAAKHGYNKRVVFDINTSFEWEELLNQCRNLDLFAERTLMELRLHTDTVNKQGSEALSQVLQSQDQSSCIIIHAPKLKTTTLNSNWAKFVQKHGKVYTAKPIPSNIWPAWIKTRLQKAGFNPTPETVQLVAKCYEGNLLACAQFVQKISNVLPAGVLEVQTIKPFVDVNSQFSVFELVDTILSGNATHTVEIFKRIMSDGVEPILVLWALTREIRNLLALHHDQQMGVSLEESAQRLGIWRSALPRIKKALGMIAPKQLEQLLQTAKKIDFICKGLQPGNAWELLLSIALELAGSKILTMEDLHL